jgi:Zn-dependent peptidase ImmA (M78 family)
MPGASRGSLRGGFRNGDSRRTAVVVPSTHPDSQRFYLARLVGCALLSPSEHLLPITDAATALQKSERAFAQELLCPWSALKDFTDTRGLDEGGITDAAEHFEVSEWVVRSTLVNRRALPRDQLPMALP